MKTWHEVKEMLPVNGIPVLTIDQLGYYEVAECNDGEWSTHSEILKMVTHWRALPLRPEMDSDYKAEKYDRLKAKIGDFYADGSGADLVDIGEAVASEFGYL